MPANSAAVCCASVWSTSQTAMRPPSDAIRRAVAAPLPRPARWVKRVHFFAAGFAAAEARQLYLFQLLRDKLSSAVRLGIIGPLEATRRQQGRYGYCSRLLEQVEGLDYTRATRAAPQLDIAQSLHDHLYSRLFQS